MITRSRAFSTATLKVVHDVAKQQFMVSMTGVKDAVLDYVCEGRNITFNNTNVPEQFQGKGVGKLLAESAFKHAHQQNLNVVCKCHFLAKYYEKNFEKYKGMKITFDLEDD